MKKGDYLVIVIILFVSVGVFSLTRAKVVNGASFLVITVDGKEEGRYPLNKDRQIHLDTKYGHNVVTIEDGKSFVSESDCKDKICMNQGSISVDKTSVICLPNRVVLTIETENQKNDIDAVIN